MNARRDADPCLSFFPEGQRRAHARDGKPDVVVGRGNERLSKWPSANSQMAGHWPASRFKKYSKLEVNKDQKLPSSQESPDLRPRRKESSNQASCPNQFDPSASATSLACELGPCWAKMAKLGKNFTQFFRVESLFFGLGIKENFYGNWLYFFFG